MSKLWGGRFTTALDEEAVKLSYSLHIDKRLAMYDIQVNLAHAKALTQAGVLTQDELNSLEGALKTLSKKDDFEGPDEDIHSCIERLLTEELGDLGKKIHTGKSRNDQVITDLRLYVKAETLEIIGLCENLLYALWQFADQNKTVIFPGLTHFQPAQPVLLGHHLLAYFEKFKRDLNRFKSVLKTTDVCPLGAGAMAGNNYGLDREFVASELGFSAITNNSMDAVSDRDFLLELCSASTICMTHMSRLCEEIVGFSSPLIGFFEIGDAFTTGSSIMPQKKNPDVAELIRGKSGRVLGHFVALQQLLKSLPLTYNRDLQEDKELTFDTVDTIKSALTCLARMIPAIRVNLGAVEASLQKGQLLATELADYLVGKQIPFRESHEITGKVVLYAVEQNKQIQDLSLDEFSQFSNQIEEDVFLCLTMDAAIKAKSVHGGTAYKEVEKQLIKLKGDFLWKEH